jgi:tetratricopeptide (TPR) repeat protein
MSDLTLKPILIALSDQIVDLSERLESDDPGIDDIYRKEARAELHDIGDELVSFLPHAQGEDRAFLHFMLGSLCSTLCLWQKADVAYAEARAFWPDHVGLLNEHFYCLMQIDRYEDALAAINASIRHGGETPDVLQNKATVLVYLDRLPEAKSVMFSCIAKFPNDAELARFLRDLDSYTSNR